MTPDKKKARGLKQQIYLDLKDRLIHCVYPPGSELNELILTEEYKVSRTPVREAISQLELEGYVRVLPKRGIYIPDISIEDAMQIFQTRSEIEPVTLKMAYPHLKASDLLSFRERFAGEEADIGEAIRLDHEMHLYLIDRCGNNYLKDMMHRVFCDATRVVIATGQNQYRIHDARQEHLNLLDSLIEREAPEICADLLQKHILSCRASTLRFFRSGEYREHLKNTRLRVRESRSE